MPASNARALEKAQSLPADALIFDLEDAVASAQKSSARATLHRALNTHDYGRREKLVRFNALDSGLFEEDLNALSDCIFDGLVLPKVESAETITTLRGAMAHAGLDDMPVWAMVETPRGVLHAPDIAKKTHGLIVGSNDLVKALRAQHQSNRHAYAYALQAVVIAARAHGASVLDGVHPDLHDAVGLEAACTQGRAFGFDGKTLIHPKQIEAANLAFGVSDIERSDANAIVTAFEEASMRGEGVTTVNGRLVESLHAAEAKACLAFAAAIDALADELEGST